MEPNNGNRELLVTRSLSVGYKSSYSNITLLTGLNLEIQKGEIISLMGPNGCGKSTLIRTLTGLISPIDGVIIIEGKNISEMPSSVKAELMGVVLTEPVFEKNLTVYDIVSMGRYRYSGWLGQIDTTDKQVIDEAISQVGLKKKVHNRLSELSDGEKQRALIAKVLTQDVDLIILDEPTSFLDLPNRMELLILLKKLAHKMGKGILLSTHELNLAMQISDKIWLIDRQGNLNRTLPEELILSDILDKTFGNDHINFLPQTASFELVPSNNYQIYVKGKGILVTSVSRMIKRLGFIHSEDEKTSNMIIETKEGSFKSIDNGKEQIYFSLESLQEFLLTKANE